MEEYFKFKREKKAGPAGAAAKLPFQALFVAAYRSLMSDSDHCMTYHKRGCAAGREKETRADASARLVRFLYVYILTSH